MRVLECVLVLRISESSISNLQFLNTSNLVLRTSESSFSESDWLPIQFSSLACIVFLQAIVTTFSFKSAREQLSVDLCLCF